MINEDYNKINKTIILHPEYRGKKRRDKEVMEKTFSSFDYPLFSSRRLDSWTLVHMYNYVT